MSKTTINEMFGFVPVTGHEGIEIEVESKNPYDDMPVNGVWSVKTDGSLRNFGREFVTKGALDINNDFTGKIKVATDYLAKQDEKGAKIIRNCPRTSVHVHYNMGNKTPVDFYKVVVTYWLIEDVLLDYCGSTRKGNLFCLRLKDAEFMIHNAIRAVEDGVNTGYGHFSSYNSETAKYGAINLSAINNFGTIEFRAMRGTVDPVIIENWGRALHNMVEFATKKFDDPDDILDYFYKEGPSTFFRSCINNETIINQVCVGDWEDRINSIAMTVSLLAYAVDWKEWKEGFYKVKKKTKRSVYDLAVEQAFRNVNAALNEIDVPALDRRAVLR